MRNSKERKRNNSEESGTGSDRTTRPSVTYPPTTALGIVLPSRTHTPQQSSIDRPSRSNQLPPTTADVTRVRRISQGSRRTSMDSKRGSFDGKAFQQRASFQPPPSSFIPPVPMLDLVFPSPLPTPGQMMAAFESRTELEPEWPEPEQEHWPEPESSSGQREPAIPMAALSPSARSSAVSLEMMGEKGEVLDISRAEDEGEEEEEEDFSPSAKKGGKRSIFAKRQAEKRGGKKSKKSKKSKGGAADDEPPLLADMVDRPKPVSMLALFRFATRFEIFLDFLGLLCAAGAGACQPCMSLVFGNLTNSFVGFATLVYNGDTADLPAAAENFRQIAAKDASYLVAIGVAMYVVTHLYMAIWTYTGEMNSKRVRERYLAAVLRQDVSFFDTLGAGEVATRIQTDTHLIQQGTSEKVPLIMTLLSSFLTGYVLAYIRSWRLALALTSILPCIILTAAVMGRILPRLTQAALHAIADGGTLAEEVISTVRTTKAFGTERILSALYDTHVTEAYTANYKTAIVNGIFLCTFFFYIYNAYALAFYYGTTLTLLGIGNIGIIVNVFLSVLIGSFSLGQIPPQMQAISNACGAAAKLFATIDRVPTIDSFSEQGKRPEKVQGNITFEDVYFDYPSRPDVKILKGLTIDFQAGKTAALVGASGSGKSTIVSLVERFYDPLHGSVKLDGTDLRELNVRWLRSQIGLVSQEPTLFATTVRQNVEYGLTGTHFEHLPAEDRFALVKAACTQANADDFIMKLPDGYETNVGQAGLLLSGGQKQRIAIARAIVANPKILLLDEATSALDTQSEGIVQNALDKASQGRTTITIAHRLSTIVHADQIYVMGDGQVLEHGTHAELLANSDGPYSRLVAAQKLRETKLEEDEEDEDEMDEEYDEDKPVGQLMTDAEAKAAAAAEVPLQRTGTGSRSIASVIMQRRREEGLLPEQQMDRDYGFFYLAKRMAMINREALKLYGFGSIFAVCTGMVYPCFGIVYGITIQSFALYQGEQLRDAGNKNALWFFLISLCAAISIGFENSLFSIAAAALTRKLRSISFSSIIRQDVSWFDEERHSTGALTAALSDNPQKISGLGGITLAAIIQSVVTVIGGIIVGLCYGWKLALVGTACIPFVIGSGYIRLRVVVMKDQKNKASHEASAQLACEVAGAIRTVASLTREKAACEEYAKSLEVPLRVSNRNSLWSSGFYALSQAMSFFAIALVFYYGSRLVSTLEYTTQQFYICLMSVTFGAIQAGAVFTFVPDMSAAKGAAAALVNLIDSVPSIDAESNKGKPLPIAKGQISFHNVHFRYPTRPGVRVLRDLSIHVNPGETVAICGASGCGKSTTIQLIERFYDPLVGTVSIDGIPITTLNVAEFRKHVAIVSQEPTLYAGTIRFNILLGANKPAEEVTQEELNAACKSANILDFINSLPDGFETQVGNKGTSLSGGQKQRLAIARALLRDPKVLLLDEATSALDSQSERVVQEALDNAAKGRTTIAIAHRLSTIQNADRIYYLKQGRVAEVGTHDELVRLRGGYYELVQLQALSKS